MFNLKKMFGFSLAEMMVVMLMLSIIFAAAAPILTKRASQTVEMKSSGSGVPVGTVILWMISNLPQGDEAGKWLECNGSTFSATAYPELKSLLGTTTLPNFIDRVPQGNSTPKSYIAAGLPNITGAINSNTSVFWNYQYTSGCFYGGTNASRSDSGYGSDSAGLKYLYFDASKSNAIYGNSTTVQMPAITVKYLIKAKS